MLELLIGNSVCTLSGLSSEQLRELRQILCYRDTSRRIEHIVRDKVTKKPVINPKTGKMRILYINPTVPLIDKRGNFPTGLLKLVNHFLVRNVLVHSRKASRVKPGPKLGMFKLDLE